MKAAQLQENKAYEDRKGAVHRTIRTITNGIVAYEENGKVAVIGAQTFAAWAARPVGARKPKKD